MDADRLRWCGANMTSHPDSEKPDFTGQIGQVALKLPDFPDRQKGSATSESASEWRFGSGGSLAINLQDDTWFDHEDQSGGGVFDLVGGELERLLGFFLLLARIHSEARYPNQKCSVALDEREHVVFLAILVDPVR